ncbi:MAG: hypothetical protein HOA85_00495, partial [Candidatus Pacebacteria bacterium]|nr:hypothetical protein [Candidatus Paceibacterota bacterium]
CFCCCAAMIAAVAPADDDISLNYTKLEKEVLTAQLIEEIYLRRN